MGSAATPRTSPQRRSRPPRPRGRKPWKGTPGGGSRDRHGIRPRGGGLTVEGGPFKERRLAEGVSLSDAAVAGEAVEVEVAAVGDEPRHRQDLDRQGADDLVADGGEARARALGGGDPYRAVLPREGDQPGGDVAAADHHRQFEEALLEEDKAVMGGVPLGDERVASDSERGRARVRDERRPARVEAIAVDPDDRRRPDGRAAVRLGRDAPRPRRSRPAGVIGSRYHRSRCRLPVSWRSCREAPRRPGSVPGGVGTDRRSRPWRSSYVPSKGPRPWRGQVRQ